MVRVLCVGALLLSLSAAARASQYHALPAEKPTEAPTGLQARFVGYDGNTNGELTIEVWNPTVAPVELKAAGLYFVPMIEADKSPQRLGAVGSYQVRVNQAWKRHEQFAIPPGEKVEVRLDVYCIDSHRASPTSQTRFSIARDRVPVNITQAIHKDATKAAAGMGGISAPAAKSVVQGEVWKARDRKWVPLEGEGKQELSKH